MSEEKIDEVLRAAAESSRPVDPALLERVKASMGPSIAPVRPLPATWALSSRTHPDLRGVWNRPEGWRWVRMAW